MADFVTTIGSLLGLSPTSQRQRDYFNEKYASRLGPLALSIAEQANINPSYNINNRRKSENVIVVDDGYNSTDVPLHTQNIAPELIKAILLRKEQQ